MHSSSAPRQGTARPQLETLEDRCLPSSAAYVTALYNDFLHRAPAATEVAGWVSTLNAGVSPTQVALDFTLSAEYLSNLIQTDYKVFLGRQPAAAEVAGWLAQLQGGLNELQLQAAFLGSGEFFARHGNANAPWLDAVYKRTLGRPVDASGLALWQQQLNAGIPREQVALDIVGSPEALTRLVTSAYNTLLG